METLSKKKEVNHAEENAKNWLASIIEMVDKLETISGSVIEENRNKQDEIETEIRDSVLSVEVRSIWHEPGANRTDVTNGEFSILLTTGGPALRLIGELTNDEPESVSMQYQDWGTPWTTYRTTQEEEKSMLIFCQQFYFED